MSYEYIRNQNPDLAIQKISSASFRKYGKVHNYSIKNVMDTFYKVVTIPKSGNKYEASIYEIEQLPEIRNISEYIFGGFETQAGICVGYCDNVVGMEYHQCSEVLITIENCILVLGQRLDIENDTYDLQNAELFYVEKGNVIELYSTTLHYMPIHTDKNLATVCMLLKGTNAPLINLRGILTEKNKYLFSLTERKGGTLCGEVKINVKQYENEIEKIVYKDENF